MGSAITVFGVSIVYTRAILTPEKWFWFFSGVLTESRKMTQLARLCLKAWTIFARPIYNEDDEVRIKRIELEERVGVAPIFKNTILYLLDPGVQKLEAPPEDGFIRWVELYPAEGKEVEGRPIGLTALLDEPQMFDGVVVVCDSHSATSQDHPIEVREIVEPTGELELKGAKGKNLLLLGNMLTRSREATAREHEIRRGWICLRKGGSFIVTFGSKQIQRSLRVTVTDDLTLKYDPVK